MKRLWQHARRYRWRWFLGCVMLLLTNAVAMAVPQLFRRAIDGIQHGMAVGDLRHIALVLVGMAGLGMVFRTLSRIWILYSARDVELALRCAFYAHLVRLDPGFFQRHPTGELMTRATQDLMQVRLMLGPGLLNSVNTVFAYATAIPLMVMISLKLTLMTFAVYPAAWVGIRFLSKRLYGHNRHQQETLGKLANFVQENLAGAQLIRAFAIEEEQERRFAGLNAALYQANVDLAWTRSGMFRISASLANVATLATVFVGAHDVLAGRQSIGDVVAIVEYMALLSWPTFVVGWVVGLWQRGLACLARLEEIFSVQPQVEAAAEALRPEKLSASFTVRHVNMHANGRQILEDINLDVPEGTVLGIVGSIGSGKSTLVQALLRLRPASSGLIALGGCDITCLDLGVLRGMFGYVSQNPVLFSKTVAENVAFGKIGSFGKVEESLRHSILAALDAAAFTPDVPMLPEGVDTLVGERGLMLSGGQKQRIAIARALILDPPILVLDDALSAVDSKTENNILNNLRRLRQGRTTLVVAHRISSVAHADEIVVLHEGRLVQRGTHATLLSEPGLYATLAHHQAMAGWQDLHL